MLSGSAALLLFKMCFYRVFLSSVFVEFFDAFLPSFTIINLLNFYFYAACQRAVFCPAISFIILCLSAISTLLHTFRLAILFMFEISEMFRPSIRMLHIDVYFHIVGVLHIF